MSEEKHKNGHKCTCKDDCDCKETPKDKQCDIEEDVLEAFDCKNKTELGEKKTYLEDLLRLQAEFDNYRKRTIKSIDTARQDGFIQAITSILPALDSFKKASEMITDAETLKGVQLIEKGIYHSIEKLGVEKIESKGEFNPDYHEAIGVEENADIPSGNIVRELTAGYIYQGKVVRFAQVIVSK